MTAAENAAAKASLAKLCDTLITRSFYSTIFDESKGALDYARWRKDLTSCMRTVGSGFLESLLFTGSVPEATTMTDADIMLDTAAGYTQLSMPQMRQQATCSWSCGRLWLPAENLCVLSPTASTPAVSCRGLASIRTKLSFFSTNI